MVSPKRRHVDIPIENGFVGMVDREEFDEFLRDRAASHGVTVLRGAFEKIARPRGTPSSIIALLRTTAQPPLKRALLLARMAHGAKWPRPKFKMRKISPMSSPIMKSSARLTPLVRIKEHAVM